MNPFNYEKHGDQKREFRVDLAAINVEERTIEVAFSSEEPVERYFGTEILDHVETSVDLGRLNDGAAVLVNHRSDNHVGVVVSARIDSDRVGRATLRFGKSERADEIFQDMRDGIRPHISVGYMILDAVLERVEDGERETWRITRWMPYEISTVSIPADSTIGVGRSKDRSETQTTPPEGEQPEKGIRIMETNTDKDSAKDVQRQIDAATAKAEKAALLKGSEEGVASERDRCREIAELGRQFGAGEYAAAAITEGKSIEDFQRFLLTHKPEKVDSSAGELGLDEKDQRQFSMLRLLNAMASDSRRDKESAAFELEVCNEAAKLRNVEPQGVYVPFEALQLSQRHLRNARGRRDMLVGTANIGGDLVATDLLGGDFIQLLLDEAVLMPNATVLTGLIGDVALPRMTAGATAYWVAENSDITESTPNVDQVTLAPNMLGALVEVSRKLLIQNSTDLEMELRRMMAQKLMIELERAALEGSGSGAEPQGLVNKSIGSVALGTNGAVPDWDMVVDLETEVATDNALAGNLGYVTSAKGRGALKKNFRNTTYGDLPLMRDDGSLNGYGVNVTNQSPDDLTKGTASGICSALFFGNWRDLLFGFWGGMDIIVNPYTGAKARRVELSIATECDLDVRHDESFAACLDMLTT